MFEFATFEYINELLIAMEMHNSNLLNMSECTLQFVHTTQSLSRESLPHAFEFICYWVFSFVFTGLFSGFGSSLLRSAKKSFLSERAKRKNELEHTVWVRVDRLRRRRRSFFHWVYMREYSEFIGHVVRRFGERYVECTVEFLTVRLFVIVRARAHTR